MSLLKRIGEPGAPAGVTNGGTGMLRNAVGQSGSARRPGSLGGGRAMDPERAAEIRRKIQERLVDQIDPRKEHNKNQISRQVEEILMALIDGEGLIISRPERLRLLELIMFDITGLGPLEDLGKVKRHR